LLGFSVPAAVPLLVFLTVCFSFLAAYVYFTRDPLLERVQLILRSQVSFRDRLALWGNSMAGIPVVSKYFGYAGTERRLKQAGFPGNMTADEFLAVKLVVLGLCVLVFMTSVATGKLFLMILCGAIVLPDVVLGQMIKSRRKAMDREFVMAAGRMALVARAGKSLSEAVRWTGNKAGSVLGVEFRRCLSQLEAGIPIEASLDALAGDTGLLSIRRMATALINAQKYGTGIADALTAAARDARRRRMDDISGQLEEREGWAMLALILMILPGVLLLLAPMLYQIRGVGFF